VGDRNVTGLFSLFTSATLHGTKGLRVMIYQMERWTDRLILAAEDDGKRLRCVATVSGLASNSTFAQALVKCESPTSRLTASVSHSGVDSLKE